VQIAGSIIFVDGKDMQLKERFNYKLKPLPNDVIEESALAVNNLTVEMINSFPATTEAHRALMVLLGKYCDKYNKADKFFFVGYNARFDYDFMRAWFEKLADKYFGSWFFFPPLDVMNIAIFHLMKERANLPNFKQATVAEYLHIPFQGEMHDANADVDVTIQILEKYLIK
jgi:DNA polymerase III epsilon subunit-like protein